MLAVDDPTRPDVAALLERHRAFGHAQSPPEDAHALRASEAADVAITLISCRAEDGTLLGIGALRVLDRAHGEIKAMHVAEAARGRGVGRAILGALLDRARRSDLERVSLETGSMAAFAPARELYAAAGFATCAPFADYRPSPHSTFMTLAL